MLHADVAGSTALVQRDEALAHTRITDAFHRLSSYGCDVLRYQPVGAGTKHEGDIEAFPLWAGQGVGLVTQVMSASGSPAGSALRRGGRFAKDPARR